MFKKKPHVFKRISTYHFFLKECAKLALSSVLCAILAQSFAAEPRQNAGPEVRMVVDISGSMKKNDPKNLRIPAVRLLTHILPSNAHAGIWTFGEYVNDLVPAQAVTDEFRTHASKQAANINSLGMFTNIGGALERASKSWSGKPIGGPRHLILLTDGVVDISKEADKNEAARADVLNRLIPMLKAQSIEVHTVALSLDADTELLRKIALATGGNFELSQSAEDLNRAFLRLFEQAAPQDSLPLQDNHFVVDKGASEITLLVFKKEGAPTTQIRTPDGKSYAKDDAPRSWRWHSEAIYDLITVPQPQEGGWKIIADVDPENRVLVVSSLKLVMKDVPGIALAGESVAIEVQLWDGDAPLANQDLLKLVEAKARVIGDNYAKELVLSGNGADFKSHFEVPALDMSYIIELDVRSPTFSRQRRVSVKGVASPLRASVNVDEHGKALVSMQIDKDVFKSDSVALNLEAIYPDGSKHQPEYHANEQGFELSIAAATNGKYQLNYSLTGTTASDRSVQLTLPSLEWEVHSAAEPAPTHENTIEKEDVAHATEPTHNDVETEAHHEQAEVAHDEASKHEEKHEDKHEEGHGWLYWVLVGLGVNIVIFGGAFGVWFWLKKKRSATKLDIDKELAIGEKKA